MVTTRGNISPGDVEIGKDLNMSPPPPALSLHPDRFLPADPGVRGAAGYRYGQVQDLPISNPRRAFPL
jgi:hypothetical protein